MQMRLPTTSIYGKSGQVGGQPTTFKYCNSGQPTERPPLIHMQDIFNTCMYVVVNYLKSVITKQTDAVT